jgi:hypothetical protein
LTLLLCLISFIRRSNNHYSLVDGLRIYKELPLISKAASSLYCGTQFLFSEGRRSGVLGEVELVRSEPSKWHSERSVPHRSIFWKTIFEID